MRAKRRVVLFVGAGASRSSGYPTNTDILPEILRRLRENDFDDRLIEANAPALRRILRRFIPRSGQDQIPQITEVLSVIDYCLESGEELFSRSKTTPKLTDVRWLLERAIARVIKKIHKRETAPRELVEWTKNGDNRKSDVTIISTNYDFSLDRVLFDELDDWNVDYLRTDFGFTWRDPQTGMLVHPSGNPKLRLYKLHGSLNWLGCSRCGNIYVNFSRTLVTLADGSGDWSTCHCGFVPLRAVLIAPSFVRRYRDRSLLSVWSSAWEALRLADEIVFVGYSLPAEDVGIRALMMRAMFARANAPIVRVVSHGADAQARYRQVFPQCEYTSDGLARFLKGTCSWETPERRRPRTRAA